MDPESILGTLGVIYRRDIEGVHHRWDASPSQDFTLTQMSNLKSPVHLLVYENPGQTHIE